MLAAFWFASGVIGLWRYDEARAVLGDALPDRLAQVAVAGGGLFDIAIGVALLIRPMMRAACFASIGLAIAYLFGSAALAPHLWADPLGPMVKVFPAIALALVVGALGEAR